MILRKEIPDTEIHYFQKKISEHPEYLDTTQIINKYLSYGLKVNPDPLINDFINTIKQALVKQTPLSVVRIGGGEANFLTYGQYPETPVLNEFAFEKIVSMQQDRFNITPEWMVYLQDSMMLAILQADIVGVIGLWRAGSPTVASLQESFFNDPRGISGHWRAIDYLLELAELGYLKNKQITSAHLYLSILDNLSLLIKSSKLTIVISNNPAIANRLQERFKHETLFIPVGTTTQDKELTTPKFLYTFYKNLPTCMKGNLCLIGAGPWSEIYCSWIKQRGGVAVDIGSGFDLLDGNIIRPVHKLLKLDKSNPYKI